MKQKKFLIIEWSSLMLTGETLMEKAVEFNRDTDGESQEELSL
jgi:hypothetical protein